MVNGGELNDAMHAVAERVEHTLDLALSREPIEGETVRPERLIEAMRHGTLGGGKRLRPFLVAESARLCGLDPASEPVLAVGGALELIHCYSLVHDDLPAMDDDDVRRGRPTVHVAYDEATAILAGDALMTVAFDLIATTNGLAAERKVAVMSMIARASGVGGMAGGQMLDLQAETEALDEQGIIMMQSMKTGALLRFASQAGPAMANASPETWSALTRYGETVGLAFQIADDLLDLTQTAEAMGKATGKDADQSKGTLVALRGEARARAKLDELIAEADAALALFGNEGRMLKALSRFVAQRDH